MVTSVARQREDVQEIPAYGLFFIEFSLCSFEQEFEINLIPWSHLNPETFLFQNSLIKVKEHRVVSCILNTLNTSVPSECLESYLKSLPTSLEKNNIEKLYLGMREEVEELLEVLKNSIQRRAIKSPPKCRDCTDSPENCNHSRIAVLFSGGLDSAVIALLLDLCLPESESIDLLNVAFMQKVTQNSRSTKKTDKKHKTENVSNLCVNYEVPDRISGKQCWEQLQELKPHRKWNFVEVIILTILILIYYCHVHYLLEIS